MTDNTQELDEIIDSAYEGEVSWTHDQLDGTSMVDDAIKRIEDEKAKTKQAIQAVIRTEKLKLLDELDKSLPTAEQLATKYGYHMPDKKHGYRLALHDIRETIEVERKKLDDHR